MRSSIIIPAHNEGELLAKTIASCLETTADLSTEIIVVDDASTDGCLDDVRVRFPSIRVYRSRRRLGPGPTRHLGARKARGRVLVFLDGHCKPAPCAIERLVTDVELSDGETLFTPRVADLDTASWEEDLSSVGHGYEIQLKDYFARWARRRTLERRGSYYVSPALTSCVLAMSRRLYRRVRGFDRHMREWGVEDLDLGLKTWLMGSAILNNPIATVGHRFRKEGEAVYPVAQDAIVCNQMISARKNLTDASWEHWQARLRRHRSAEVVEAAQSRFDRVRAGVERERRYLMRNRARDEFWFARRFGLDWPA